MNTYLNNIEAALEGEFYAIDDTVESLKDRVYPYSYNSRSDLPDVIGTVWNIRRDTTRLIHLVRALTKKGCLPPELLRMESELACVKKMYDLNDRQYQRAVMYSHTSKKVLLGVLDYYQERRYNLEYRIEIFIDRLIDEGSIY